MHVVDDVAAVLAAVQIDGNEARLRRHEAGALFTRLRTSSWLPAGSLTVVNRVQMPSLLRISDGDASSTPSARWGMTSSGRGGFRLSPPMLPR
jgi:hypothetical protein